MKYFMIVVVIVLAIFAVMRLNKAGIGPGADESLHDKYPYPTSGKLLNEGVRPAMDAKNAQALKKLATAGAQADVDAFMSAYSAAVGGATLGDLELITTGEPEEGPESVTVEATDQGGSMLFEGVLLVDNPNDNLLYEIVGASVK